MFGKTTDGENCHSIRIFGHTRYTAHAPSVFYPVWDPTDLDRCSGAQAVIETNLAKLAFKPAVVPFQKIVHLPVMQPERYRELQSSSAGFYPQSDARRAWIFLHCNRQTTASHLDCALALHGSFGRR